MFKLIMISAFAFVFVACSASALPLTTDTCGEAPGAPCCDVDMGECAPGLICWHHRGGPPAACIIAQ